MSRVNGIAEETIPFGSLVLVRGNRVSVAGPELANARADHPRFWGQDDKEYREGQWVSATTIEGLGARDLNAIANGPIMDANEVYLPAGRLTQTAYEKRTAEQFREAGIRKGSPA